MVRPTHAVVDLDGLTANYRAIGRYLAASGESPPRIIAVIKANAYGHGAVQIARALEQADLGAADLPLILACADIEEGLELRRAGVNVSILVFGALSVSDVAGIFDYHLTPTVSSPSAAKVLGEAAAARSTCLGVHLKIDTGMNRFGFRYDNLRETLPAVLDSNYLSVEAVYTHFATAECEEDALFLSQLERFEQVRAAASMLGLSDVWWHAANSAALLCNRRTWYDAVRPGLLLYGVVPPPLETDLDLHPVMSLRSRVVSVKGMRRGESAGYGARFVASRPMQIAIIPAGYADGLDLRLGGRGSVLVCGARAPIVTVAMDSTTIDVTDVSVIPGDDVVVLGEQRNERIGACDIAQVIGTRPHEVLCRVGTRIERTYKLAQTDP